MPPKVAQYIVRSNIHMMNLDTSINRLLGREMFIDVTLACDGHKFQCHRLILAASSPLFEELLIENPTQHPIVILPGGIKAYTLKSLIDFMYKGQTNVSQTGLKALVESAELLQVKGLYDAHTQFRQYYEDVDDIMDQQDEDQVEHNHHEEEIQEEHNNEEEYQQQTYDHEHTASDSDSGNLQNQNPKQRIIDIIEIEDSEDVPNEEDVILPDTSVGYEGMTTDSTIPTNPAPAISNETITKDVKVLENGALQTQNAPNVVTAIPVVHVEPDMKLIKFYRITGGPSNGSQVPPWTYIHIPAAPKKVPSASGLQAPPTSTQLPWTFDQLPKLSTKPKQLADSASAPSFLKYNSSSMAISVKNLDRSPTQERVKVVNMAMETEPETETVPMEINHTQEPSGDQIQIKREAAPGTGEIELGETLLSEADFPMFYAMMKKERDEKAAQLAREKEAEIRVEPEAENIICQPNVSYIYGGYDDETYGNEEDLLQQLEGKPKKQQKKRQSKTKKPDESQPAFFPPGLLPVPKSHRLKHPPTLVPLSVMQAGLGPKHFFYHHKLNTDENGKIVFKKDRSILNTVSNSPPREGGTHSPQTVILRNPRCNQPRHYSTDSLYNALMAVKYGESIYRASRLHQVPRKTLRNWMKRWDIKSQYPMPKQLKDAAKKKKQSQTQQQPQTQTI